MYKQTLIVLIILIYVNNNADSIALAPHAVAGVAVSIGQVSNSLKVGMMIFNYILDLYFVFGSKNY